MSNPKHQPTEKDRATVKAMTAYGISQADIAAVIGIDSKTMRLYYAKEIETAAAEANSAVAQSLFNMATKGNNVAAAIFWLKIRNRWTERLIIQEGESEIDPATLTDTDLSDRISRLRGIAAARGIAASADLPEQPNGVLH